MNKANRLRAECAFARRSRAHALGSASEVWKAPSLDEGRLKPRLKVRKSLLYSHK